MTPRKLFIRLAWSLIALCTIVVTQIVISENENSIAEWIAPAHVPLSQEEIFARSNIPCVRPPGAKDGCVYPKIEEPSSTAYSAALAQFNSDMAIGTPEFVNRQNYIKREIVPRRDRLNLWSHLILGLALIALVLYMMTVMRTWWKIHGSIGLVKFGKKLSLYDFAATIKGIGTSYKLRRVESDFKALKSLHENGLVSDQAFEQRKYDLRKSVDGQVPSND